MSDEFALDNVPDEDEIIFEKGKASLQLNTFMQDAATAAGLFNVPFEGEVILNKGAATFPFQTFIDDLAG